MDGRFRSAARRKAIEAEAIDRFLKARASNTEEDWEEAYRWISEDPEHGVAFARAEAGWELAERLREVPAGRLEELGSETVTECLEEAPRAAARHQGFTRRILVGAIAASIVAIFGIVALQFGSAVDHYRTAVGEQRTVQLRDGSSIMLNTGTSVEVAIGDEQRSIRLLRGEASFQVAPDHTRPFTVDVDGTVIRAVGTAFTIRIRPDLTEVTVSHGVVAVREAGSTERRITAGSAAAVRRGAVAVTSLGDGEIERRLAWQNGRLTFNGETLSQVVDEFNRYRSSPIVIGDPALSGVRIGGTFHSDGSEAFALALEQSFGIRAVPGDDGSLLLVSAEESSE